MSELQTHLNLHLPLRMGSFFECLARKAATLEVAEEGQGGVCVCVCVCVCACLFVLALLGCLVPGRTFEALCDTMRLSFVRPTPSAAEPHVPSTDFLSLCEIQERHVGAHYTETISGQI